MNRSDIFEILKGTEWGDSIYRKLSDMKKGKVDNMESILLNSMNEWFNRDVEIPYDIMIKYATFAASTVKYNDVIGISMDVAKRILNKATTCFNSKQNISITKVNDYNLDVVATSNIIKFID